MNQRLTALLLIGGLLPSIADAQTEALPFGEAEGIVQVLEGDLLSVGGSVVRLYGIDAPELGQRCEAPSGRPFDCGEASRLALENMIGNRTLRCTLFATIENQRRSGLCRYGNQDIAMLHVENGWAFSERGISNRYEKSESKAQKRRAGLWAGRAQRPWVWRQQRVLSEAADG